MTVALVTGVGGGIGRAIASRLADDGCEVAITDLPDALDAALAAGEAGGLSRAASRHPFPCDLADSATVAATVAAVTDRLGVPIVVVSAAGGVRGQTGRPLDAVTDADWHAVFDANVHGAFHLARACLPAMAALGAGRFVTIGSGAGLRPSLTGIQAYTAAKHALVGLTRQLSQEYAPSGLTVNCVAPGFVLSNEATRRQWDAYGEEGQRRLIERIHTRRLGRPEDVADAVAFLAGNEASWITGQVLSVDGGVS